MAVNLSDLQLTSTDGILSLYSYGGCDTSKVANDTPGHLKACRGVVVENSTGSVVWQTFGFADEYVDELPQQSLDGYRMYNSLEGTSLRLFFYSDKWYLATHRKLNAFSSKWGSGKSFGQLFVDGLMANHGFVYPEWLETLDKSKLYVFFVQCTPENRIVCFSPPHPKVWHVATFAKEGLEDPTVTVGVDQQHPVATCGADPPVGLPTPPRGADSGVLLDYVRKLDPRWFQGVILRKGMHEIKILNAEYAGLSLLRDNEPSLALRYVQVRACVDKYIPFTSLYFDSQPLFDHIEALIKSEACRLCELYTKRYIEGKFDYLGTTEHLLIKSVNKKFRRTRDEEDGHALYMRFLYEMAGLNPTYLYRLISDKL